MDCDDTKRNNALHFPNQLKWVGEAGTNTKQKKK